MTEVQKRCAGTVKQKHLSRQQASSTMEQPLQQPKQHAHLSLCSAPSGLPGVRPVMWASWETASPRANATRSVGSCQPVWSCAEAWLLEASWPLSPGSSPVMPTPANTHGSTTPPCCIRHRLSQCPKSWQTALTEATWLLHMPHPTRLHLRWPCRFQDFSRTCSTCRAA